jgi:hypothetical protein
MSTNPSHKSNKSTRIASDLKLMNGLKAHYAETDTFLVSTNSHTVAQVIALIVARTDASTAYDAAHAAWIDAAKVAKQRFTESEAILRGVRNTLRTTLGEDSKALADFGLTPKAPKRTLTAEQKAAAAAKRAATRKARNVMGSRQRLKVVAPPAPTPNAAPQAASPSPAPAPRRRPRPPSRRRPRPARSVS